MKLLVTSLSALFVLALQARLEESPGTVIGRYKLLQKIAEGGTGVVYMAIWKRAGRKDRPAIHSSWDFTLTYQTDQTNALDPVKS